MEALNIQTFLSTVYHPQTDGQSERTNQTVEEALRAMIFSMDKPENWIGEIPKLSLVFNNSIKHSTTKLAPSEILYGFKIREPMSLIAIDPLGNEDLEAFTEDEV